MGIQISHSVIFKATCEAVDFMCHLNLTRYGHTEQVFYGRSMNAERLINVRCFFEV